MGYAAPMNRKTAVSRFTVALSASALVIAAVPAMAPAKSVKIKNGTYKGSVLNNGGDEGSDFRTPLSISVSKGKISKIVLSNSSLWAADQPADVANGGEPQSCQQAGTAPGSPYSPTITFRFVSSPNPVKISSKGSFSVNATTAAVGSPISSVTYATSGNSPTPAGTTQLSFKGRFSSSKKAKGTLTSLSIAMGAGIEKFTCNSYWVAGQTSPWGIPSAPK